MSSTMPAAGLRPAPDGANPADIVVRNARIYTSDRGQPTASAVAISGGVFTAVGDDAAVAGHVGANTRIVDGLGGRVIPGLNDSHMRLPGCPAGPFTRSRPGSRRWGGWSPGGKMPAPGRKAGRGAATTG